MKKLVISKSWSLKNWDLLKCLKGNWKSIKEIAKVGAPLVLGWLATNHPAWTVFITLLGKFVLDVGEYYVKEQHNIKENL